METVKVHKFQLNVDADRPVCICGKAVIDPVHVAEVKMVRGTATPDTVKR